MSHGDLPELPDDIAALLRDARGDAPVPVSDRRKVAARLALSTGVAIPSASLAGAKLVAATWVGRAVGLVALLAAGTVAVGGLRRPPLSPPPVARSAPRSAHAASTSRPDAPPRRHPPPSLPPSLPDPPHAAPAPPRSTPSLDPSLEAELALIEGAHAALSRGEFADADALLTRHARRHPRGRLAPEREALRVESLAAQGDRVAAELARARFHQRFPRSVLGAAVDRAVQR